MSSFPSDNNKNIFSIIKHDFSTSMQFICKEQPNILKMLLLISLSRFFVIGTAIIGLPYIIRTILELNAKYYAVAESILGIATILGSITAGFLVEKLKICRLSFLLTILGIFFIPAGIIFLFPASIATKYMIIVAAFCGMQITTSIFSIFIVSFIQQKIPNYLIGKVMSYTSTITICIQPLGQVIYGLLFDRFNNAVYLVLIPTGIIVCMIGLSSARFFKNLEKE